MFRYSQLHRLNYLVESPDQDLRIVRILDPVWTHDTPLLLAEVASSGMTHLEVDLSRVRKMCTAAFAELLILRQRLARYGCEMRLHGFQQQPWSLCCVLKLVKLLSHISS
jgi:ABC-type transporter Mla MlaB component